MQTLYNECICQVNYMDIKLIHTEEDYHGVLGRIDELWNAEPGTPEGDELDLLILLTKHYEEEHHQIPSPDPIEAIKYIMEELCLNPKDLVGIIGDKASVSKILNKKRKLTMDMIRNLHLHLNIPHSLLIEDYELNL